MRFRKIHRIHYNAVILDWLDRELQQTSMRRIDERIAEGILFRLESWYFISRINWRTLYFIRDHYPFTAEGYRYFLTLLASWENLSGAHFIEAPFPQEQYLEEPYRYKNAEPPFSDRSSKRLAGFKVDSEASWRDLFTGKARTDKHAARRRFPRRLYDYMLYAGGFAGLAVIVSFGYTSLHTGRNTGKTVFVNPNEETLARRRWIPSDPYIGEISRHTAMDFSDDLWPSDWMPSFGMENRNQDHRLQENGNRSGISSEDEPVMKRSTATIEASGPDISTEPERILYKSEMRNRKMDHISRTDAFKADSLSDSMMQKVRLTGRPAYEPYDLTRIRKPWNPDTLQRDVDDGHPSLSDLSKKDFVKPGPVLDQTQMSLSGPMISTDKRATTIESDRKAKKPLEIRFRLDRVSIRPSVVPLLKGLVQLLRKNQSVHVRICGHTCDLGPSDYNVRLGWRRAGAVRDWLVGHGIDRSRIRIDSRGEREPRYPNRGIGRVKNRRVEIIVE